MWRYLKKIGGLYNRYIRGHHEEPRFLIITSFIVAFVLARLAVYNIEFHMLPFLPTQSIIIYDIHVHHLVFGIFLLLIAGFIRIPQFGSKLFRLSSILYGTGAALTLDEFALWLRFDPTAYFGPEGRISIDAVVLFLLITLSTLWHGIFWKKLFRFTIKYLFFKKKNQFATLV